MGWFKRFLTSSIGQKIIMSLTGLFLIVFLVVHLIGNLQLLPFLNHDLLEEPGRQFNEYTLFMTTNPLIKTISIGLYVFILIHAIQGIVLAINNRKARGAQKYAVKVTRKANKGIMSAGSNHMALLGTLIFAFIGIHMGDFWFQMKVGALETVRYENVVMSNLYTAVYASFKQWWIVAFYVFSMVVLSFHLMHGFWSAFQTLGLHHKKYTPFIKAVGVVYSIVVPALFALIPIYYFFFID